MKTLITSLLIISIDSILGFADNNVPLFDFHSSTMMNNKNMTSYNLFDQIKFTNDGLDQNSSYFPKIDSIYNSRPSNMNFSSSHSNSNSNSNHSRYNQQTSQYTSNSNDRSQYSYASIENLANQLVNDSSMMSKTNNLKLKKQKLFFGRQLPLFKRTNQKGYGAFLMLCEPDTTCVTPQTKLAIANCMNTGGSSLANQLYNSCSNQNRIQCTDQDVSRRLLGCLRLQSGNNVLISAQSRACVRQVVTLGTLDCFVKILRQKPKYRLGTRYSTVSPDSGSGAVTAAGFGEGNVDPVEDPDSDGRKMIKRQAIDDYLESVPEVNATKDSINLETANDSIQLVTSNYDDYGYETNKTLSNETYSDQYVGSETNENYDQYAGGVGGEVMDIRQDNSTSNNETVDYDNFEEGMDGEYDDEIPIPISSNEMFSSNSTLTESDQEYQQAANQTTSSKDTGNVSSGTDHSRSNDQRINRRTKRQCRHNRRLNKKRRWRERSGRSNKRANPKYYKDESQDLRNQEETDEDDHKWEMIQKRRG